MKRYAIVTAAALAAFLIVRAQEPQAAPAPTDAAALVKAGDAAVAARHFDQADLYYAQAAALPDSAATEPALLYLGLKAYRLGNPQAAEAFFQRLLAIDQTSPLAGRALTWMGVMRGRDTATSAEAETFYQRALAVENPASIDAADTLKNYASLLARLNRTVEAAALEQRAREVQSRSHEGRQAKQQTLPAQVYRMTDGMTPPKLLSKVEPAYTEEARNAKIQGTTLLYVEIGPDGYARNIRVNRSLEPGLDQKAIDAVSQWQFLPGMKDGITVTVAATIEVNFRLQ